MERLLISLGVMAFFFSLTLYMRIRDLEKRLEKFEKHADEMKL